MMSEGGGGGCGGESVGGEGDGVASQAGGPCWGLEPGGGEEVVVMGGGGATTLYNREDGATVLELADGTTTVLPPGNTSGITQQQSSSSCLGSGSGGPGRLTVKVEGGGSAAAAEALTAIVDGRTGTATLVEGAEVVRTLAVSYATPILHHVFLHTTQSATPHHQQTIIPHNSSASSITTQLQQTNGSTTPFILHHAALAAPRSSIKEEVVVRGSIAATSVSPSQAGSGRIMTIGLPALSSTPSLAELQAYAPASSSSSSGHVTTPPSSRSLSPLAVQPNSPSQQLTLGGGSGGGHNQNNGHVKNDDELTSLSWLHQSNLLRGTGLSPVKNGVTVVEGQTTFRMANGNEIKAESPTSDYGDESSDALEPGELTLSDQPFTKASRSQPIPYNPQVHVNAKPPYSFSCLIFMAIEDSANKALPVKDIYAWILEHFPYFRSAPTGWKNSVRHNLSLNKCFRKVEKAPNLGKGSLWMVDAAYRPNLLQALSKTPFHPYSNLDRIYMVSTKATYNNRPVLYRQVGEGAQGSASVNTFISPVSGLVRTEIMPESEPVSPVGSPSKASSANVPNPDLFPYLARRLGGSTSTAGSDALAASGVHSEDVDAAAAMLALKHGPRMLTPANDSYSKIREGKDTSVLYEENKKKKRKRKHTEIGSSRMMVISSSPSQDHAYTGPGAWVPNGINEESPEKHGPNQTTQLQPQQLNHITHGSVAGRGYYQNGVITEIDQTHPAKKTHLRSPTSSVDEAFSDDSYDSDANSVDGAASEARRIVEGADALLNLAAVATSLASQRRGYDVYERTPSPAGTSPPSPQYQQHHQRHRPQQHTQTTTTQMKQNHHGNVPELHEQQQQYHNKNYHCDNNNTKDSTCLHNNNTINTNNNKVLKVKRFGTVPARKETSQSKIPTARRNLNLLKK